MQLRSTTRSRPVQTTPKKPATEPRVPGAPRKPPTESRARRAKPVLPVPDTPAALEAPLRARSFSESCETDTAPVHVSTTTTYTAATADGDEYVPSPVDDVYIPYPVVLRTDPATVFAYAVMSRLGDPRARGLLHSALSATARPVGSMFDGHSSEPPCRRCEDWAIDSENDLPN
jgi:hypothetical protein